MRPESLPELMTGYLAELTEAGLDAATPLTVAAVLADLLSLAEVPVAAWPPAVAAYLEERPAA